MMLCKRVFGDFRRKGNEMTEVAEATSHFADVDIPRLMRALTGREEDEGLAERYPELAGFPNDSDGSAKVALIGIDDSIEAWELLLQHMPDEDNSITNVRGHLATLRNDIERAFPLARSFVRPGFDQEV